MGTTEAPRSLPARCATQGWKSSIRVCGRRQSRSSVPHWEDADVIGLSILSGAHMRICPRIMELLAEKDISDVLVVVGGIIPDVDIAGLNEIGIRGIFLPGTPMQHIVDFINGNVRSRVGLA